MFRQFRTRTTLRLMSVLGMLAVLVAQTVSVAPAQAAVTQWYYFQQFENGVMLANGNSILVLVASGQAYEFPKSVYESLTAFHFSGAGPGTPGSRQPSGAFGTLWRNVPDLRDRLGWALGAERSYRAQVGAGGGTYISLPSGGTVKVNMGVLTPPDVTFRLMNGGSIKAMNGAWAWVKVAPPPCSEAPQRIQFARGSYSGVMRGTSSITCPRANFVLWARAGQRMIVQLSSGGPMVGLLFVPNGGLRNGYSNAAPIFDGILPVSGNYTIEISQDTRFAAWEGQYTLTVTIY